MKPDKKFTQRLKETPKISVTTIRTLKQERAFKGIAEIQEKIKAS